MRVWSCDRDIFYVGKKPEHCEVLAYSTEHQQYQIILNHLRHSFIHSLIIWVTQRSFSSHSFMAPPRPTVRVSSSSYKINYIIGIKSFTIFFWTFDTVWQMTHDTWQRCQVPSSNVFGVIVFWRFFRKRMTDWMKESTTEVFVRIWLVSSFFLSWIFSNVNGNVEWYCKYFF